MGKEIKSDGITTTISDNGVVQSISDGNYSADTKNTSKIHSQSGRVESATSRNVETTGNSQEYCWTRGVTCESNVKVVGNPEQFEGSTLNKIHEHLSELAALLVQPGDNRRSLSLPSLPKLDFTKITSSMTSSMSASLSPPTPYIKSWDDIATYTANFAEWFGKINASNVRERATRAAALEIERQALQQEENIRSASENVKDILTRNPLVGSTSTQDIAKTPEYNIDRRTVYGTIDMDYITNLEKNV